MIIMTGGAGFIGSAIVWQLNKRGVDDIVVVDHLGETEKWKNLVPLSFSDYFDKSDFIEKLEAGYFGNSISAIFHIGACSSTTERNADYLVENNYRYSARLAAWHEEHRFCRFIYAPPAPPPMETVGGAIVMQRMNYTFFVRSICTDIQSTCLITLLFAKDGCRILWG